MADETCMSDRHVICKSADLKEGGKGLRFQVAWHGQAMPAFVIRYQGQPHAFLNQCGHLPVELDWQEVRRLAERPEYRILPELEKLAGEVAHELGKPNPCHS